MRRSDTCASDTQILLHPRQANIEPERYIASIKRVRRLSACSLLSACCLIHGTREIHWALLRGTQGKQAWPAACAEATGWWGHPTGECVVHSAVLSSSVLSSVTPITTQKTMQGLEGSRAPAHAAFPGTTQQTVIE